MPASVAWENVEKTIIRQQLIGNWSFEEYMKSASETQTLTASQPHTVHVIIDFTASDSHPTRLLAAGNSLDRNLPSNQGIVVVVQCPTYVQAVFEILVKMYPRVGANSFNAESLEEAYALIRQHEAQE
jgi:hypothetical protein